MPPMVIADLGAGEGTFSQLLARRAETRDRGGQFREDGEFGANLARKHTVWPTSNTASATWKPCRSAMAKWILHSSASRCTTRLHPGDAIEEAWRILKPGGRIVILDLHAPSV